MTTSDSQPISDQERQLVMLAERSIKMLKRHRADFVKVTAERIRIMERFIANPRQGTMAVVKLVMHPLKGL